MLRHPAFATALIYCLAIRAATATQPPSLPTLTTAKAVHNLTTAEAKRAFPVRLKATVVAYLPAWHLHVRSRWQERRVR